MDGRKDNATSKSSSKKLKNQSPVKFEILQQYVPEDENAPREIPRRALINWSIAQQRYRKAVVEAGAELATEFTNHFWKEIIKGKTPSSGSGDAAQKLPPPTSNHLLKHRFVYYLNSSGRYLVLREHLRQAVQAIAQQRALNMRPSGYKNHKDFQEFLHDLYNYLVDEMRETLARTELLEGDPIEPRIPKSLCNKDLDFASHSELKRGKLLRDLLFYAQERFAQRDFDSCHRLHLERICRSGELSNCWVDFALMWLSRGDDRMAEIAAREALQKDPENIYALLTGGLVTILNLDQRGLDAISTALDMKPCCPELLVIYGLALAMFADGEESQVQFRRAAYLNRVLTGQSTQELEEAWKNENAERHVQKQEEQGGGDECGDDLNSRRRTKSIPDNFKLEDCLLPALSPSLLLPWNVTEFTSKMEELQDLDVDDIIWENDRASEANDSFMSVGVEAADLATTLNKLSTLSKKRKSGKIKKLNESLGEGESSKMSMPEENIRKSKPQNRKQSAKPAEGGPGAGDTVKSRSASKIKKGSQASANNGAVEMEEPNMESNNSDPQSRKASNDTDTSVNPRGSSHALALQAFKVRLSSNNPLAKPKFKKDRNSDPQNYVDAGVGDDEVLGDKRRSKRKSSSKKGMVKDKQEEHASADKNVRKVPSDHVERTSVASSGGWGAVYGEEPKENVQPPKEGEEEEGEAKPPGLVPRLGSEFIWAAELLMKLRMFEMLDDVLARELNSSGKRTIQYLYIKGMSLYLRKNQMDAIPYFEEALTLDPENPSLWMLRGHCFYELDQAPEAIQCYEMALRLPVGKENRHLLYIRYGTLSADAGQLSTAKRIFLYGIQKYPTPNLWLALGTTCYMMEDYDEAETAFSEANKLDSSCPITWAHLALVNLVRGHQALAAQAYKWAMRFGLKRGKLLEKIKKLQKEKGFGDPTFPEIPTCIPHDYYVRRIGRHKPFEVYSDALFQEPPRMGRRRYENTEGEDALMEKLIRVPTEEEGATGAQEPPEVIVVAQGHGLLPALPPREPNNNNDDNNNDMPDQ